MPDYSSQYFDYKVKFPFTHTDYCFEKTLLSISNKWILYTIYMISILFLIYKLKWKVPYGNIISISVYVCSLTVVVIAGTLDFSNELKEVTIGNKKVKFVWNMEVTSDEAWNITNSCFKTTAR